MRRFAVGLSFYLLFHASWGALLARPIDPSIDDAPGPFCYFSRPSTVIGVADGPEGAQVTPEGWLWTGAAELVFMAGSDLEPLRQRIQTLADGFLPIVEYSVERDGMVYEVTMFGATLDGKPESNLVCFVRVRVRNAGKAAGPATFAVALRADGPNLCDGMRQSFNVLGATYELGPFYAARDGAIIYTFSETPRPRRFIVPDREDPGPIKASDEFITRRAPVCMVRYDLTVPAGGAQDIYLKMPYYPVPLTSPEVDLLREASFDDYLARTREWWRKYLALGAQIELPEEKVVNAWRAGLVYDSIARDKAGDDYIAKVNEFQYDAFWVRDGAYIVASFDFYGRHDWAAQSLDFFLKQQQADGIMYQPPQLDGFGQSLWAMGNHWRLTGDMAFARRVYPYLASHVRGVIEKAHADPLGLIPPAPPYDNEAINGHYTGHSLWFLTGLRDVIAIADALGEDAAAAQFRAWFDEYRSKFLAAVSDVTAQTGGYLPPGLDAGPGCDWGNLLLTYPRGGVPSRGVFDPTDPVVTATVDTVRSRKYAEGIMTYGPGLAVHGLHHYVTIKLTQNLVNMNRQRDCLADFYGWLVHTSSTHAGFEGGIAPWDNRDPGGNLPPHGWSAAMYNGLLRNMLVREWDGHLHLFTVLSPAWVKAGSRIAIRRMPTEFGPVTADTQIEENRWGIRLQAAWRTPPRDIVVHIPWFADARSAAVDGKPAAVTAAPFGEGQQVVIPASAKELFVRWRLEDVPEISYEAAVAAWKAENRKRFEQYVEAGGRPEPLWPEGRLLMTREERQDAWAELESQVGIAAGCPATASHSEEGHPPSAAVDGDTSRTSYWGATPYPAWWQVDLGAVKPLDRIRVITFWDHGPEPRYYQFRVLVSEDGQTWQQVADMSDNTKPATPGGIDFPVGGRKGRYVRVEMLKNSANIGVHLVEVMVFAADEAPVVDAPAQPFVAWTAEGQSGSQGQDFPTWGFVGAERIVLDGAKIARPASRVRLVFRAGQDTGITIGDVSLARTDASDAADIVSASRVPVTFAGSSVVEIPAGGTAASDWVRFDLLPGQDYSVTFSVVKTGGATIWPDERTRRFEAGLGAVRAAKWSRLGASATYNIYFLERVEGGD